MNKIDNPKWTDFKERLLPLPFFLLMTLAVALFLGGLLFLMYSVILVVALKSAMVFLLIFAASGILIGAGLLSLNGFFAYGKYYNSKTGKQLDSSKPSPKKPTSEKSFKDYFTLQNIALVVLLIAAICAVISAALGAMQRDKWVQTISAYMEKNNYYADIKYREYKYTLGSEQDINNIVVDLYDKNAVVIYTTDEQKQGFLVINGYEKYKNQITLSKSGRTLTVSEGEQPSLDGAMEKLLFFMFDENKIESQIKIYIPENMKDAVLVEGELIIAKQDQQGNKNN